MVLFLRNVKIDPSSSEHSEGMMRAPHLRCFFYTGSGKITWIQARRDGFIRSFEHSFAEMLLQGSYAHPPPYAAHTHFLNCQSEVIFIPNRDAEKVHLFNIFILFLYQKGEIYFFKQVVAFSRVRAFFFFFWKITSEESFPGNCKSDTDCALDFILHFSDRVFFLFLFAIFLVWI